MAATSAVTLTRGAGLVLMAAMARSRTSDAAHRLDTGQHEPSGGRKGLWVPRPDKSGALRLTTTGRRSGEPRSVIVGYYEDEPNLVSMAMNGWGAAEPAWWLNLQADPQAVVELAGGIRRPTRCPRRWTPWSLRGAGGH